MLANVNHHSRTMLVRWLAYPRITQVISNRLKSDETHQPKQTQEETVDPKSYFYPNTSVGIKERHIKPDSPPEGPLQTPYPPFPDNKNPKTGEVGGPVGPEPTRFGDWERKGRVTDF